MRQSGTPGNLNGGGFDPILGAGAQDYSQQDAAQINPTDLTTSGAGSTTLTSASAPFTALMVGNVIHITAGTNFQANWYQVVSFTDASNVVLDRTPSSGAAGSVGVGYLGGAISLNSTLDDEFFESVVAGNTVWVQKTGSDILLGESVSISSAGTAALGINIEGYEAAHGDLDDATLTDANTPLIICGPTFIFTLGAFWNCKFVRLTGSSTAVLVATGGGNKVIGCKSTNTSTTTTRIAMTIGSTSSLIRSEAISYRGYAVSSSGGGSQAYLYNYIHDSDNGIRLQSTGIYRVIGNLIQGCVTAAVAITSTPTDVIILQNTLYGQPGVGGIGVSIATGTTNVVLMNNILTEFTRGVVHADAQTAGYDDFNCYANNDLTNTNWPVGPNTTTNQPTFTNVAEINFSDGTTSGFVVTSATSDFSTVTDGVSFLYLVSGTGITVGKYLITAHTPTTLTLDLAPGTNATADKTGGIVTGYDFLPTGDI